MMPKNGTAVHSRQVWTTNLAPLVVAARQGASHAAVTARQELARARQVRRPWWRSRWAAATAAGIVVAGAAGGIAALVAHQRSPEDSSEAIGDEQPGASVRSTVEVGRARMADLTRTMLHRIRRTDPALAGEGVHAAPLAATHQNDRHRSASA